MLGIDDRGNLLNDQAADKNSHSAATTNEGVADWVREHVWSPVKDNVIAPLADVGIQAANAVHVTDGVNLVKHGLNATGFTHLTDSNKPTPMFVPESNNFCQKLVQEASSTAASLLLYTVMAKVGSRAFSASSRALAIGAESMNVATVTEESTLLSRSYENSATLLRTGSKVIGVLAKEQNSLLVGATVYGAARDPESGETRWGNAAGAFTQFGLYRAGNARWSSSFSEEAGLFNKIKNVAVPRAIIGATAGLSADAVSSTISQSINNRTFTPALSAQWKDGMLTNAAINVLLPSLLRGGAPRVVSDAASAESAAPHDSSTVPVEPAKDAGKFQTSLDSPKSLSGAGIDSEVPPSPEVIALTHAVVEPGPRELTEQTAAKALPPAEVGQAKVGDRVGRPGGTDPNYPFIDEYDAVKKVIHKRDGSVITLMDSNKVVIHEVGQQPQTRSVEGFLYRVQDGKVVERIPKSVMPIERKSLNVASCASEGIGKELSNFAERPFTLHGKAYASVEAWYQGLKWPEESKREEVAGLSGVEAKRAGRGAPKSDTFNYEGKDVKFGSPEHHALVKEAIKASLEQNPTVKAAFVETHPRPILHQTGRPENPTTALPGSKFAKILEEIRQEFVDEKNAKAGAPQGDTKDGTSVAAAGMDADKDKTLNKDGRGDDNAKASVQIQTQPLSNLINNITDEDPRAEFNLPAIAAAFKGSDLPTTGFRGVENNTLSFDMTDGRILRVSRNTPAPDFGNRAFDLPILERGTVENNGAKVEYFVQPAAPPANQSAFEPFIGQLMENGFKFVATDRAKVVTYNGQTKLNDPWAVKPLTEAEKVSFRRMGYNIP
jgi:predicted NAD-dependent protein-ADP-ribosyltransferase YbiA (DUF1768 family)